LFHYYKSIIDELCARGHAVHILFDAAKNKTESFDVVAAYVENNPLCSYATIPSRSDRWTSILFPARDFLSYRKYLVVAEQADHWRTDWIEKALPRNIRNFLRNKNSLLNTFFKTRVAGALLRIPEHFVPPDAGISAFLRDYKPDVVIGAPGNMRNSSADTEFLKAARALGIPTVLPVMSWDNLTVRGLIHVIPDLLLAWNEEHMREAITHHAVPKERIRITGSPLFDQWLVRRKPSESRAAFCQRYGFNNKCPVILYLGSSKNIARDESWVIKKIASRLRQSKKRALQDAHIIIRPHPANIHPFEHLSLPNVTLQKDAQLPEKEAAASLFADSVFFADAIVGVNTSAMLDAMALGKPVITFMPQQYEETQNASLHFRNLLSHQATPIAKNEDELLCVIEDIMEHKNSYDRQRKRFISQFIWPRGTEYSAGTVAAREIELLVKKR